MSAADRVRKALEAIRRSGSLHPELLEGLTDAEKDLIRDLEKQGLLEEALEFSAELDVDRDLGEVREKIAEIRKPVVPLWKSALKYAAVFTGIAILSFLFQPEEESWNYPTVSQSVITLRTGHNRVQVIDQAQRQQILSSSGDVLAVQEGGNLRYSPDAPVDQLVYNELHIPNGSTLVVALSDGTRVRLNSGTTMRYPARFLKGRYREVYISGEAYFEVAKDKTHPFVVHAQDVAVQVLGTEFNISSYEEDSEVATVLVEGSVKMTHAKVPGEGLILVPGNKGSWDKVTHASSLEEVDTDLYTGWIRGELVFRNTPFERMVNTLERQYGVTIENTSEELAEKALTATFNAKIETIDDVLKAIGEIHPITYENTNGTIRIETKKEGL